MKPFLSVCMIVKDEENVIKRCLESITGIADEIIVVDTGSKDKTREIASVYTNLVYDYNWNDNFSKARNFAASKASGEWILALDADEYVERESFSRFKRTFSGKLIKENIFSVQIVNFVGLLGNQTVQNYHERFYKNDDSIYYDRKIHEKLQHVDGNEKRGILELEIFHSGYLVSAKKDKNKTARNLKLLKSIHDKTGIDYYYLGNEYFSLGDFEEAIVYYKKGYQHKDSFEFEWVVKLLIRMVISLHELNRNSEALSIIESCEGVYDKIADFKFNKAKILLDSGKNKEAIQLLEYIIEHKNRLQVFYSKDYLEYLPHKYLGEIYEKEGNIQLAVFHYSRSLSVNEADNDSWNKLITLLGKFSSKHEMLQFIQSNVLTRKSMNTSRLLTILVSTPLLNIQKLINEYVPEKSSSTKEVDAIRLKFWLLNKQYEQVSEEISGISTEELKSLLLTNIFTVYDFILLTLKLRNTNNKMLIKQLKFDFSITSLLDVLFLNKKKKLSKYELDVFCKIYQQAIVINDSQLINLFINKQNLLDKDYKVMIKKRIKNI
ncbi:glycosyltransferase [Metabacillus schmidteae]|uniref:glycosyltransferase n=1 Tax=Metabacillus schmidteae TaxID=2730405 RepID=UPI00158B11C4|nr:glycosyltransferase [Metabacillus schmidteae]